MIGEWALNGIDFDFTGGQSSQFGREEYGFGVGEGVRRGMAGLGGDVCRQRAERVLHQTYV